MPHLRLITHQSYGPHPRQRFDLVVPENADGCPTIICLPGGWWMTGDASDLRDAAIALAEHDFAVAIVHHRPLAAGGDGATAGRDILADVLAAAAAASDLASIHGAEPRALALVGSGSGSLTALVAAATLAKDPAWRIRAAIACGVTASLEPHEGCQPQIRSQLIAFAHGDSADLSPVQLGADSFPPLLLLHGDDDREVPAPQAQRLHARVVEAGESSSLAVLSGLGHQFLERCRERGGRDAIERIVAFVNDQAPPRHAREQRIRPGSTAAAGMGAS